MFRLATWLKRIELFVLTVSVLIIADTFLRNSYPHKRENILPLVTIQSIADSSISNSQVTKKALLLSYQRSGSSFLGYLFNQNPDAFFVFEPIDGVYCAMYGTASGWNVPSDIFNFGNGSYRPIPQDEIDAISETIDNMFQCKMNAVPTEVLMHHFIFMWLPRQKRFLDFANCRRAIEKKGKASLSYCQTNIKKYCPYRFGRSMTRSNICKILIWDVRKHPTDYSMTNWDKIVKNKFRDKRKIFGEPAETVLNHFKKYHTCMSNLTFKLRKCLPKLQKACNETTIRSIKSVRVTMETAETLLEKMPDLQIFHLIRDPRAVAVSRMKQSSFRGLNSGADLAKEAFLYCERALNDINIRKKLDLLFPENLHQIIYEDFVLNYLQRTNDIYNAMQLSTPEVVLRWVKDNTVSKKNSSIIASSWAKNMTYDVVLNINRDCRHFYEESTYHWL